MDNHTLTMLSVFSLTCPIRPNKYFRQLTHILKLFSKLSGQILPSQNAHNGYFRRVDRTPLAEGLPMPKVKLRNK